MKVRGIILFACLCVVISACAVKYDNDKEIAVTDDKDYEVLANKIIEDQMSIKQRVTPVPDFDLGNLAIVRKEDEDAYADRDGCDESNDTANGNIGETECVIGEDSDSVGEDYGTDILEFGNDEDSMSELVVTGEYNAISERGTEEYSTGDSRDDADISSIPDGEPELTYLGNWTITFYCPCAECCGEWATGCTANGNPAIEWYTVATDMFDFGTQLYIEGLGYFVVDDRGVSGEWIDVFVNDHQTALDLGLQYREVYLVG